MAKTKVSNEIDGILKDLYTAAGGDFEKKLLVAREMVDLEKARLKALGEGGGGDTPEGLKD